MQKLRNLLLLFLFCMFARSLHFYYWIFDADGDPLVFNLLWAEVEEGSPFIWKYN